MGILMNNTICLKSATQDRLIHDLFLGVERVPVCKFIRVNWDIRGLLNHIKKTKPENLLATTDLRKSTAPQFRPQKGQET